MLKAFIVDSPIKEVRDDPSLKLLPELAVLKFPVYTWDSSPLLIEELIV